jgi:hypothetical protein
MSQKARNLLALTLPQAKALGSLWQALPGGLLPPSFLAAGGTGLRGCTIAELCRFWLQFGGSAAWEDIGVAWEASLQVGGCLAAHPPARPPPPPPPARLPCQAACRAWMQLVG